MACHNQRIAGTSPNQADSILCISLRPLEIIMTTIRLLPWIALPILLASCTAKYQVNNLAGREGEVRLNPQEAVYVVPSQDGAYGNTHYPGSGQTVAQVVAGAFSKNARKVHVADKFITKDAALDDAKRAGARYLVTPAITHWEQRATEWSGRPSRMAIRLSITDVESGEQITSSSIEGRSRIVSWTTTSPESLLREPVIAHISSLYANERTR